MAATTVMATRNDLCEYSTRSPVFFKARCTTGPLHQRVRRKMDLFLFLTVCVMALTVQYPGPMSAVFALLLLKIAVSWLRSRRY